MPTKKVHVRDHKRRKPYQQERIHVDDYNRTQDVGSHIFPGPAEIGPRNPESFWETEKENERRAREELREHGEEQISTLTSAKDYAERGDLEQAIKLIAIAEADFYSQYESYQSEVGSDTLEDYELSFHTSRDEAIREVAKKYRRD